MRILKFNLNFNNQKLIMQIIRNEYVIKKVRLKIASADSR